MGAAHEQQMNQVSKPRAAAAESIDCEQCVKQPYDQDFVCPICMMIPFKMMEMPCTCKCLVCHGCYKSLIKTHRPGHMKKCLNNVPYTGEPYESGFFARKLASLEVYCENHKHGCQVKINMFSNGKMYNQHTSQCEYSPVTCPDCKQLIGEKNIQKHHSQECLYRLIPCKYCNTFVRSIDMEKHCSTLDKIKNPTGYCENMIFCPNGCIDEKIPIQCTDKVSSGGRGGGGGGVNGGNGGSSSSSNGGGTSNFNDIKGTHTATHTTTTHNPTTNPLPSSITTNTTTSTTFSTPALPISTTSFTSNTGDHNDRKMYRVTVIPKHSNNHHLCPLDKVYCSQCKSYDILRKDLEHHRTHECQYRQVPCVECKKYIVLSKLDAHMKNLVFPDLKCMSFTYCIHCESKENIYFLKSQEYKDHLAVCPERPILCKICYEPMKSKMKETHNREKALQHVKLLQETVKQLSIEKKKCTCQHNNDTNKDATENAMTRIDNVNQKAPSSSKIRKRKFNVYDEITVLD
jgi:hypothetical protein